MRRLPSALLLPLCLLALAACKSPCLELSQRVCECRETRVEQDACRRNAETNEGRLEPDQAAQDTCEALLDSCPAIDDDNRVQACEALETTEGKLACGLTAVPPVTSP
jgi:hypothetical protein